MAQARSASERVREACAEKEREMEMLRVTCDTAVRDSHELVEAERRAADAAAGARAREREELERAADEAQEQVGGLRKEIARLEQELAAEKAVRGSREQALRAAQEERERMEMQVKEKARLEQERLGREREEKERRERAAEDAQGQIEALRKELAKLEEAVAAEEALRQSELHTRLAVAEERERDSQMLKAAEEERERVVRELKAAEEEQERVVRALKAAEEEQERVVRELKASEEERERVVRELKAAEEEVQACRSRTDGLEARISELQDARAAVAEHAGAEPAEAEQAGGEQWGVEAGGSAAGSLSAPPPPAEACEAGGSVEQALRSLQAQLEDKLAVIQLLEDNLSGAQQVASLNLYPLLLAPYPLRRTPRPPTARHA